MDYKKAKDLRGKSFSERMAENLISGSGIGESFKKTLSEKSKARMTGIKEKFDPLNIAKALTGGSRLGPALLGKMTGRSQQDLQYFAGDPKKQKLNQYLDGVNRDYTKYYDHIIGEKQQHHKALMLLKEYMDDLMKTENLVDDQLRIVKHDQKEIIGEIDKVKVELDELIQ